MTENTHRSREFETLLNTHPSSREPTAAPSVSVNDRAESGRSGQRTTARRTAPTYHQETDAADARSSGSPRAGDKAKASAAASVPARPSRNSRASSQPGVRPAVQGADASATVAGEDAAGGAPEGSAPRRLDDLTPSSASDTAETTRDADTSDSADTRPLGTDPATVFAVPILPVAVSGPGAATPTGPSSAPADLPSGLLPSGGTDMARPGKTPAAGRTTADSARLDEGTNPADGTTPASPPGIASPFPATPVRTPSPHRDERDEAGASDDGAAEAGSPSDAVLFEPETMPANPDRTQNAATMPATPVDPGQTPSTTQLAPNPILTVHQTHATTSTMTLALQDTAHGVLHLQIDTSDGDTTRIRIESSDQQMLHDLRHDHAELSALIGLSGADATPQKVSFEFAPTPDAPPSGFGQGPSGQGGYGHPQDHPASGGGTPNLSGPGPASARSNASGTTPDIRAGRSWALGTLNITA
ncbi:hypothetical protein KGY14_14435 [Ameyamaea chiangmaiensis]|nr:hypothetical protein [Ameyamaea chiangmaiensis]MBS4076384.1 hypothetical protein [Ameyamaea chiangmaiensis]